MLGFKSAALPGVAAAREIFLGFSALTDEEKKLVAELILRITPGLIANSDGAQALPMSKILEMLKKAFTTAWVGILRPKKLVIDLVSAFENDPAGAELRGFCEQIARECKAITPLGDAEP